MARNALLLVADDLTGAADCAAYAPALGLPAFIHPNELPSALAGALHACVTNSRALDADAARASVQKWLAAQRAIPAARCFKKIDSLLRGNVGSEIEAMLAVVAAPAALICPALPAQERSVVEGRIVGPSVDVHVGALLARQSALPQVHIALVTVRSDKAALAAHMKAAALHAPFITADAQSDADLDALTSAWRVAVPNGLLCGSAGLAAAWLRAHAPTTAAPLPPCDSIPPIDLVVVGSASAMAHAQIGAAAALPEVQVVKVHGVALPDMLPTLRLILCLPRPAATPSHKACAMAAQKLAAAACAHMQRSPVRHLLIAGGDTAQALAARLAITRLEVQSAATPGMPTCIATRAEDAPLWITLKAGNHGTAGTIARLMQESYHNGEPRGPRLDGSV